MSYDGLFVFHPRDDEFHQKHRITSNSSLSIPKFSTPHAGYLLLPWFDYALKQVSSTSGGKYQLRI
jgi:hypothetical protein